VVALSDVRTLHRGRFLALLDDAGWEYVTRIRGHAVVAIVATTPDAIVLVEQRRAAVGRTVIELPAGLVGDHDGSESEAILDAAQRELLEETGFEATDWSVVLEGPVSAGLTDETVTLLRATGLTRVTDGGGDESESITVHVVPLAQAQAFLRASAARGCAIDHKVLTGLWVAGQAWDQRPIEG
jgi:ADP-ribose pyrophosphatase